MIKGLSDAEYEIMQIVWSCMPEPTLFAVLQKEMEASGHPCHKNTLITLLGRLINKGYLSANKVGRRNEYSALISEKQFQQHETQDFLDKYHGGSAASLMTTLVQGDMLTSEEYAQLKALFEET